MAEERRANRSGEKGDAEGRERRQRRRRRIRGRKEHFRKDEDRCGRIDVEVEEFDRGANQAGKQHLRGAVDDGGDTTVLAHFDSGQVVVGPGGVQHKPFSLISPYPACLLRYNGAAVEWNIIALNFVYATLGVVLMFLSYRVMLGIATPAFAQTERYDDTFRKYSKRYFGPLFDWRLFKAQAMAESNLQTTARSWAGARGIMQLMPTTLHEIRSKNPEIIGRWDRPEWNIAAGIAYSRQL